MKEQGDEECSKKVEYEAVGRLEAKNARGNAEEESGEGVERREGLEEKS